MPPASRRPANTSQHAASGKKSPIAWLQDLVLALSIDRRYFFHLVSLLLVGELVLGVLIIRFIPYTKIDWDAYMQHVKCFLDGQRDYSKLEGETGPAVYPALFLYAYTALYKLLPLDPDERVRAAQYVFLGIYLVTLALVSGIYYSAGRTLPSSPSTSGQSPSSKGLTASIRSLLARNPYPQALLIPLCLSKRLHSIYMLRLFNDPIAMVLLYAGVWAMMRRTEMGWRVGVLLYSLALGIKMNILLFLPGLLVLLVQYRGLLKTIEAVLTIVVVQLALPAAFFLRSTLSAQSYFNTAFDFSRQFMYKWTVNWRFVPEETFLSKEFATYLLAGHLFFLVVFALFKWSPVPGGTKNVLLNAISRPSQPAATQAYSIPNHHIPLVLFTSNLIGLTFARSLHYQFHSWYFHQIPFLLYSGGAWGNLPLGLTLWLGIEYAWVTYPSTNLSSGILSAAHAVIIFGLLSTRSGTTGPVGVAPGEASRKSGTADFDSRKTR